MSESVPELENLLQFMYINPTTKIEIRGHITSDSWMEPALKNSWSYELSLNRAKTVFDYLEEKGVASERMTYEGFADWEKIYKAPQSGEEHTANRRVEIKILSDAEFKKLKESRMAGRK